MENALLEQLKADLSHEREITEQVRRHLAAYHDVGPEGIVAFLRESLVSLEEYEVDLLFAPMFTPTVEDQARYAPFLGLPGVPPETEARLVRQLASGMVRATFHVGEERVVLPLHEVTIERYVRLLNLTAPLDETLGRQIVRWVPQMDQARVQALGRQPVWQGKERAALLAAFLRKASQQERFSWAKVRLLTDLVRSLRPDSPSDFARRLENLADAYEAGEPTPFYSEQIEAQYQEVSPVPRRNVPSRARVLPLLQAIRADLEQIVEEHGKCQNSP